MSWIVKEAKDHRPLMMASCYLGPLLILCGYLGFYSFRIAAAVVCIFGIAQTLHLMAHGTLTQVQGLLSIVGHLLVWVPFMGHKSPIKETLLHSFTLLIFVLGLYWVSGTWPYTLSPMVAIGVALTVATVVTTA